MRRRSRQDIQFITELPEDREQALAVYNSERARGLVHTDEWQAKMADEQRLFDRGYWLVPDGVEVLNASRL